MEYFKSKFKFDASTVMRFSQTFSLVTLLVFAVACGSTANETSSQNNTKTQTSLSSANSTVGEVATAVNNDSNSNIQTPQERRLERIEKLRDEAANNAKPTASGMSSRPGPEDSVITTQLTDVAREERTWSKHPILLKVLKIHDGKEGSIKVTLRDGRGFDLPGSSIPQLDQIASSAVLHLVGVTPPTMRQDRSKTKKLGN